MSRDGSGIYHLPSGLYPQAPNTTIESGDWNNLVADLEQDANIVRPIVAGGTGAGSVPLARANLQAERAIATVTNYATQVFESGSFTSGPGATDSPEGAGAAAGYFVGTALLVGDASNILLRAFAWSDVNKKQWQRLKTNGVWGAWTSADYRDGFTAIGDISITKSNPQLYLNRATPASEVARVSFQTNGLARMSIGLWPGPEGGANVGGDLVVVRNTDGGAIIDIPFVILRQTGFVGIGTATPTFQLEVVHNANDAGNLRVTNNNGGSAARADLLVSNGTNNAYFGIRGTGNTVAGSMLAANDGQVGADQAISIFALTGPIKFAAGGTAEQMRLGTNGILSFSAGGGIATARSAANGPAFYNGSAPVITIPNGGSSAVLAQIASGFLMLTCPTVGYDTALYLFGGGGPNSMFAGGPNFVAPTTAPPAGKISVAYDGSTGIRIYNNTGGAITITATGFAGA